MASVFFVLREVIGLAGQVLNLIRAERAPKKGGANRMLNGVTVEQRGAGRSLKLDDFGGGKITAFAPSQLGSGWSNVNALAAYRLNVFLKALPYAWRITSAWRSAEKNREVGGAADSRHLSGEAFDVQIDDPHFYGQDRLQFYVGLARECGFNGIGLYEPGAAIHVDVRKQPASWGAVVEGGRRVYIKLAEFISRYGPAVGGVAVAVVGALIFLAIAGRHS